MNEVHKEDELHLGTYTILGTEPLHDIKGHLGNLLKELPYTPPHKVRENTQEIIEANSTEKITGADYRVTAIGLLLSLMQAIVDPAILLLVETVVRISELLYLPEKKGHHTTFFNSTTTLGHIIRCCAALC